LVEDLVGPLGWQVQVATADGEVWPAVPLLTPPAGAVVEGGEGFAVGTVGDGVGYLALARTGPFDADTAESERILAANVDKSLVGSAFILDLRSTDGGILGHALLVATRFFPSESLVVHLEARDGDGFVPAGDLTVNPVPTGTYDGQVFVLIGPRTRGVGELLAAILGELPNVTLIGAPTAGMPGPPLIRFLPNGWSVAVPNLRVMDPEGSIIGAVVPHIAADDPLGAALDLAG
jgi:C-terminal processing protease CtpA/Prc